MEADRVIRWTSAAAVIGVAAVAAVASYEHAYHLVRARGAGVDRRSGPADGGRVDVRELDGDAGLGSARGAGSGAGEVAARPGHRGDAGGERSCASCARLLLPRFSVSSPMVVVVRSVPWWGLVSSAVAPVLLVGGWTLAAGLQPGSFDAVTGTISSLAAEGAADRWVMTLALAGTGACHVITGLALRPASSAGRLILMAGGAATVLVAAFPETAGGGGSLPHTFWSTVAFVALAVWPLAACRRGPLVRPGCGRVSAPSRPGCCLACSCGSARS